MQLKNGYQALTLPAGQRDTWGDLKPLSEEETIAELDAFLTELSNQGGEIVTSFERTVTLPKRGGSTGLPTEKRLFLIVKK